MGKVHGSLARAGKVRGQTPKVAKQDKKKKPRGRAHKRMQAFSDRFFPLFFAVVGFGKKRGPNSSENLGLKVVFVPGWSWVGRTRGVNRGSWSSANDVGSGLQQRQCQLRTVDIQLHLQLERVEQTLGVR
ncbi:hypothetical protein ZIOFF_034930 [Zingiber officinale]|uniref:40S ribosomal protein S30 n=1 Tax=Zingiber officinale TaxID=94328 RepID=A0A8J5L039_ZINOF|nr:hypothetical protein ZIOFF_034930 [Zingiber officinale]